VSFEYKTSKEDNDIQFLKDHGWDEKLADVELLLFDSENLSNQNFYKDMLQAVKEEKQFYNLNFTEKHSNDKKLISLIKYMIKSFDQQ